MWLKEDVWLVGEQCTKGKRRGGGGMKRLGGVNKYRNYREIELKIVGGV
jgi:hypothetical protein